jgi:integrase
MLTNATVKAAAAAARPYKLADAGGLYLLVRPNGSRCFRMKYRFGRKEKLLTFGAWPELQLGEARALRDRAREQLRRNIDPSISTSPASSAGESFEQLGRRWHAEQLAHWSPVHAADVLDSLERDVFPAIGAKAPAAIKSRDVLDLLRAVERRGCLETARRLRERISGIFRLGIHDELCEADPAAMVADRMGPRPLTRPQPALTDIGAARVLLAAAAAAPGAPIVKLASRFLALTAVRMAALRGAGWHELEELDGPAPIWRIPPARMKLTKVRKGDPAAGHVVPLSRQAVDVLRLLWPLSGANGWLFPGRTGFPIGEGAIGELYRRAGYAGRHVPHGWRASFSTIMNEHYPDDRQLIDQALGHKAGKSRVEAAYNRARHDARMRGLMQRWADLLEPRLKALPAPPAFAEENREKMHP